MGPLNMSRRRAAGSRRNKHHKFVGRRLADSTPVLSADGMYPMGQFDWGMAPNHGARAVDITKCFPVLEGKHGA